MNTMNRDTNNEAAQTLASTFARTTITKTPASGATTTPTNADGDTATTRHETRTHNFLGETHAKKTETGGGITLRARDTIDNNQKTTAAWAEKTETHQEPTHYGDDKETTETISLHTMPEGDLRPTPPTNTTRYKRKTEHPDSRLKHGNVSVTADSTHTTPSLRRP